MVRCRTGDSACQSVEFVNAIYRRLVIDAPFRMRISRARGSTGTKAETVCLVTWFESQRDRARFRVDTWITIVTAATVAKQMQRPLGRHLSVQFQRSVRPCAVTRQVPRPILTPLIHVVQRSLQQSRQVCANLPFWRLHPTISQPYP